MNWKEKDFRILGLSKTEKEILNILDSSKNIQDIAKDSGISRTGVNHAIKHLIYKGFVTRELIGKRMIYSSIDLNELIYKIQQTLNQVKISNKDKKGAIIKISREDEFIIHVGIKEIIPAYKRIALENKNERIRAIQHHRSWNELIKKISPEQVIEFNQSIKENNLIIDGMLNKGAYEAYKDEIKNDPEKNKDVIESLEGRSADYTLFSNEFFNYDAEIWIFKNTTLVINWHKEVAIEITDENITGFFKDMYDFTKNSGDKIDHNQAIRKAIK